MKKLFRYVIFGLGLGTVLGSILLSLLLLSKPKERIDVFTHKIVQDINPAAVIDIATLSSEAGIFVFSSNITERLVDDGVFLLSPKGIFLNMNKLPYSLDLIIDSNGGSVYLGFQLMKKMRELRAAGITVNCYVNRAQSMAFTVLSTSCDKRIGVGKVELMQHRIYYPDHGNTVLTFKDDIKVSKLESDALNQDSEAWLKLTRHSKEDHVFTEEEIKKYNLINSQYDVK